MPRRFAQARVYDGLGTPCSGGYRAGDTSGNGEATIVSDEQTISETYRDMQRELHLNPRYGIASLAYARLVRDLFQRTGAKSISDYGAGKCNLRKGLEKEGLTGFDYYPYDPAFPEYGPPRAGDLSCCIDVLEHIEPEYLDAVLRDLTRITPKFGFFTVASGPATKILSDGRNAHLIQQPRDWWLARFEALFTVAQASNQTPHGFWIIVRAK